MSILNSHNYIIDTPFIVSSYIREYDISKANINILYKYKVLTKEQYEYYLTVDRMTRQRDIGIMQKDNKIVKILQQGILEAKKMFFEANGITESDIVAIKNDAVFILNKIPTVTKFDNIEFVNKNIYTSFYKLPYGLELYYYYDMVNNVEKLDVKGISEDRLKLHEEYFLEFLKVTLSSAQMDSIENTLDIVITFYDKYLKKELDLGYYRTFNSESVYCIRRDISDYNMYKAYFLEEYNKIDVDITHNLYIIRQLYQYYSSLHLSGIRKY